jgi:DMSO/TMAO reductase YedYZ heme-binding membrane subunit
MIFAGNGTALWYVTRGSGVVALLLLTAGLVLGIVGTLRWRTARWPRFAVVAIHRNLTLFAIVFVAIHVVTTVLDGYAPIGLKDAVVPFVSRYRPLWLGFGALAFDLLLALVVTSLARSRIGYQTWRAIHWLSYAAWPVALVHGLGSGSDARFGWFRIVALLCVAAVAAAVGYRLVRPGVPVPVRAAAVATATGFVVFVVVWYSGGPGRAGWAARAGTPASILSRHSVVQPVAAAARQRPIPASFDDRLVGRMARSNDAAGDVGIAFGAASRGTVAGVLRLTLWGAQSSEGGVAMTDSSVSFAPTDLGSYSGKVVGLSGNEVIADLNNGSGQHLRLTVGLQIDNGAGTFTGSLHGETTGGSGE